ncbi:MAG: AAA-like domain-containing protein [Planctomycetota bacterium]|nr:AAA-like domain-containing protein [Planctomycetota bacterium]MDP7249928.1 AAA-like domain-containing protein [Planctomycetota bacterium]
MKRRFNTTGPCIPHDHYMLPAQARLADLKDVIDQKLFFVIHAARQTGKTTLIQDLVRELNEGDEYYALYTTLETVEVIPDAEQGIPAIVRVLNSDIQDHEALSGFPFAENAEVTNYNDLLRLCLSQFCRQLDRPLVIMFDEADCLSETTLVSFLRQLRAGYVKRAAAPFVHSLALVGVKNLRDYKARYRDDRETLRTASPFNIVKKALTMRNFTTEEVGTLLRQHEEDTGQEFPESVIDRISDQTQGQPWLTNALAAEIVDEILEADTSQPIQLPQVGQAIENLILRRDTHIDSLLDKLKLERVRRVMEPVLVGAEETFEPTDDDVQFLLDLGLLKRENGSLTPANPIYSEVIARTLNQRTQYSLMQKGGPVGCASYRTDYGLDVSRILTDFQSFWRQHSEIWQERYEYKEAAPHLILMAFLQNILNGEGATIREYGTGRGRVDICMVHEESRYPIELKVRRSDETAEEGQKQLAQYMDRLGCLEGWLVIFDRRPDISWDEKIFLEEAAREGRTIYVVGC